MNNEVKNRKENKSGEYSKKNQEKREKIQKSSQRNNQQKWTIGSSNSLYKQFFHVEIR